MTSSLSEALSAAPILVRALIGSGVGAIVGSYLAVVLTRWPRRRSTLRGRSSCDACGEALRARDLVPILSYAAARGKCRHCGAAIDPAHLLIELGGALIGLVALVSHPGFAGLITAIFGWWLLVLAALDARHQWLPDKLTLPLAAAGLGAAMLDLGPPFEPRLIGALAGFLGLWAIGAAYRAVRGREGLGGGDPKLLGGIGAWLGWQQLPFVLLGAGLLGLASLLLTRSRGGTIRSTDRLPLGTLMALAAWPLWLLAATR